ncbi:MAG: TIGR03435 family protein [Vicinamibacterales bacterium]
MTPHFSEDKPDEFAAAVAQFRRALDRRVDAHLKAHPRADLPRAASPAAPRFSTRPWALAAAAALVIAVIGGAMVWPRGVRVYAAGADGLQVTLADDSRVEMRAYSELTVGPASDGIQIDLKKGDIIVSAARQRDVPLYVRTKDMTVAVEGTVLLVNGGQDGSRVAVIEGEARVRERIGETRLRPGEEVATSTAIAGRPVMEEIAWSRNAAAHRSILESFRHGIAQTAGPLSPVGPPAQRQRGAGAASPAAVEFEEASIRECDPDNLPALPAGARGGGANSFYMTPGRTYALCMTVATLIRTAYNYGPMAFDFSRPIGSKGIGPVGRGLVLNAVFGLGIEDGLRVRGGPDWVRSEPYTIEAVAGGTPDAETMRGPMLLALLESRFKLKAHIETEQVPAFALTVAPGGPKMKAVQASGISPEGFIEKTVFTDDCEPGPPPDVPAIRIPRSPAEVRGGAKPSCGLTSSLNGPNFVMVGGAAGIPNLARQLGGRLGNVRVIDRTGIGGLFNFILEFVIDENTPGQVFATQRAEDPAAVPRGQTIFAALEQQLGLRLEPARAPREFIVIDQIERPGPN